MQDRITIDPQIHFEKACVAGTRIPVQSVRELIREQLHSSFVVIEPGRHRIRSV